MAQLQFHKPVRAAMLIAFVFLSSGCRSDNLPVARGDGKRRARPSGPWFEEIAADVGLDFHHQIGQRRFLFPEIIAGGVAMFDADNDGDLDVYCVQAGDFSASPNERPPNQLFRNRGDGTFEDITTTAGVGDRGYGMGCACGDFDFDGDVDLYVTNHGPNVLYRNNGDGTFTDVTKACGVGDAGWGTSAGFFDADGDGDLDLFVVNYVAWQAETEIHCNRSTGERDYCNPENYNAPARDTFYRNNGDGTFTDATRSAGFDAAFGNGLGVAFADFNDDDRVDVYVANDGNPNQLWMNLGNNRFQNDALIAGCAVNSRGAAEAGMGVVAIDADADGDLDLFMTHLRNESNTFYVNHRGNFDDRTAQLGLASPSIQYTGFGVGLADFDHDGRIDLYVANGKVTLDGVADPAGMPDPYVEPNQLMRGTAGGAFEEVNPIGGTAAPLIGTSRAAAFGDIDGDGDIDIAVVESNGPIRLLRNIAAKEGRHSIRFRVLDEKGLTALNARLVIKAGDQTFTRYVNPSYGYCASHDPIVHVGIGPAKVVDSVAIRWPDGTGQSFGPHAAGEMHTLRKSQP